MKEKVLKIEENSKQEIKACEDLKRLGELKVKYLGKKGELTFNSPNLFRSSHALISCFEFSSILSTLKRTKRTNNTERPT